MEATLEQHISFPEQHQHCNTWWNGNGAESCNGNSGVQMEPVNLQKPKSFMQRLLDASYHKAEELKQHLPSSELISLLDRATACLRHESTLLEVRSRMYACMCGSALEWQYACTQDFLVAYCMQGDGPGWYVRCAY